MARPSLQRTITRKFRVNADEDARLLSDAAEATKGDISDLVRQRVFAGAPLVTGKGVPRPELRRCLELATALQGKLKGLDPDADRDMQQLSDILYNALKHDH